MGEEKIKERQIPGLMNNIIEYDVGTGIKYQITIGQRAGFGDDSTNHFYITLPEGTSEDTLRHINNVMHDSIHAARRQAKAQIQHKLCELMGASREYSY